MHRRRTLERAAGFGLLAVMLACGGKAAEPGTPLGKGVRLVPPSGTGPLTVVWSASDELEAVGSDGDVVVVVGSEINAYRAASGEHLFRYEGPSGDPLGASGGVRIGTDDAGALEVFAPFEYDALLDRTSGRSIRFETGVGEAPPVTFHDFPPMPPKDFRVDVTGNDSQRIAVTSADGVPLGTIYVDVRNYSAPAPMQVGDTLILSLESGNVVALRRHLPASVTSGSN